ncbi:MAG: GntR family transcriptional regulator [Thermomicrobiales bacterium]
MGSRSRSEQAYHAVKGAILSLELRPDTPLVETHLATRLGISTTPLRDALARLQQEGLIVSIPYKGTFVAPITLDDAREILDIRQSLEGDAITVASGQLTDADFAAARDLLDQQRATLAANDRDGCAMLGRQFHLTLQAHCRNRRRAAILENLEQQFQRIRVLSGRIPGRLPKSIEEHAAILAALEKGAGEVAGSLMREHLQAVYRDLESDREFLAVVQGI